MIRVGTIGWRAALVGVPWAILAFVPGSTHPKVLPVTPDFGLEIVPILTKAGCNSGTCHGAAIGQGGFHLSLLGYDPASDYDAIVREFGGRRVDLANPDESLILLKPSTSIAHGGGKRLPKESAAFGAVAAWLHAGAPRGIDSRKVVGLSVEPKQILLSKAGDTARIAVVAVLNDGAKLNRTDLALYTPLDDSVASVSPGGVVTILAKGSTDVMIRCQGQVAAVRVTVPVGDKPVDVSALKTGNPIDAAIAADLQQSRIPPSPICDDATFLRRVHLDLTGSLPDPGEIRAFLAQPPSATKRASLVDKLLRSSAYVDLWTQRFGDWLLLNPKKLGTESLASTTAFIRSQIETDAPIDKLVENFLTSSSGPQAALFRLNADPRDVGEYVGRTFLGKRIQCARCHNHPFDKWTQTEYHEFAAIFAKIQYSGGRITVNPRGQVEHPKTGKSVEPAVLDSAPVEMAKDKDPRGLLGPWMQGAAHEWFARSFGNRLWKWMAGRGIVEPVDDLRPTNPPSNPALLDALAKTLESSGFSLRKTLRAIVLSATYQLDSRPVPGNAADSKSFAKSIVKPLTGALMVDAIAQATGEADDYAGYPPGTRAVQVVDTSAPSYELDVFGRCSRDVDCNTDASAGGGLPRSLHLMNSPMIEAKVRSCIRALVAGGLKGDALVDELYLRTVSRFPSTQERQRWALEMARGNTSQVAEDLLWSLLNSREFGAIR